MPLARSRDYLSIGEVLETIRPDWPDVSISKIRFLENEGLIAPERTESGYRKFYEPDVARLRYVLALQRDQFLPLKVIKQRLARWDGTANADTGRAAEAPAEDQDRGEADAEGDPNARAEHRAGVSLTRDELRQAAGLSEQQVSGLEDFSVLPRKQGDYDADDVSLAKAAVGLFDFGLEPRHMRMFRQSAEREAALIDQIVAPLARRRDPATRGEAAEAIRRLLALTRQLREALLRSSLRELL